MLDNLASPFNCIYSAAKIKDDPKFPEANILGSGAFQFVEYVRGSHLTTKRFEGYFRQGLPYLDGYKAFFVKTNAVVPGMIGGQFDVEFRGRTPSERDQLMSSADKERWVLHEGPWATNDIVIFNTEQKPFDDPRVRRALSLAIDRWNGNEALSKITIVKATGGMLRPGYEYALPEAEIEKIPGYWRDIEKSRAEAQAAAQGGRAREPEVPAAQPHAGRALYAGRRVPDRPVAAHRRHGRALARSRPRPTSATWSTASSTSRSIP